MGDSRFPAGADGSFLCQDPGYLPLIRGSIGTASLTETPAKPDYSLKVMTAPPLSATRQTGFLLNLLLIILFTFKR